MTRSELWDLLHDRASDLREGCVREWQLARQDVERLQQHAARLEQLGHDYGRQHQDVQQQAHQVRETAELRHTMRQLMVLQQRTSLQLQAAVAHEAQCRARLQRAEAEVLKTRTLSEQAHGQAARAAAAAQQRRDDELAVAGWLRARAEPGV